MDGGGPILFYDGECGLCARSVRWCLRHDRRGVLRFAPLQGSTYAAVDLPNKPSGLSTMALLDGDGLHTESEAWARVMRLIGGGWAMVGKAMLLVPRPVRDAVYRFVAKRRHRWFGGADSCELGGEGVRARFLA